jgi:hypothetical protein
MFIFLELALAQKKKMDAHHCSKQILQASLLLMVVTLVTNHASGMWCCVMLWNYIITNFRTTLHHTLNLFEDPRKLSPVSGQLAVSPDNGWSCVHER